MTFEEKRETHTTDPGRRDPTGAAGLPAHAGRRPFVPPQLTRHEPLVNITLLSNGDWGGGGSGGGTFFG